MITWIQKTFQQHFRIVFLVLLAVVVISFVFVFNASSGLGRNQAGSIKRPFFGLDLGNDQDRARLMRDGSLSALLQYGGRLGETQIQQLAYIRAALLRTADQLHLPSPTDADIRAYIQRLGIFTDRQGQFNATLYNNIRQSPDVLSQATGYNITPADFARILAEDTRIAITQQLLAGPGYALPSDVQQFLKRADTTWTLQTAAIDRDSFKPTITPTDTQITQQFETNPARYTIPPRVRVTYAEIPNAAHAPATAPADADIRAFYDANPARFPKPVNTAPASLALTGTDSDYLLVRPQVEAALRQQLAARAAYKAASDLSYKLYADKVSPGTPEFTRLLDQNHATLNTTLRDFSAADIPPPLSTNAPATAKEIAVLDSTNPISNAIATATSSLVLFWQDTTPARQPALDEVRAQVTADIVAQEKQRLFTALGETLRAQIQTALAAGTTFDQAVTDAAAKNNITATTKTLAPFTLRTAPQDLAPYIPPALDNLAQGAVTSMITTENTGHLIYAKTAQPPDLTEANPAYADTARQIGALNARATASGYIQSLVDAELAKSTPKGVAAPTGE